MNDRSKFLSYFDLFRLYSKPLHYFGWILILISTYCFIKRKYEMSKSLKNDFSFQNFIFISHFLNDDTIDIFIYPMGLRSSKGNRNVTYRKLKSLNIFFILFSAFINSSRNYVYIQYFLNIHPSTHTHKHIYYSVKNFMVCFCFLILWKGSVIKACC